MASALLALAAALLPLPGRAGSAVWWELGDVPLGTERQHRFTLVNPGPDLLAILDGQSSCSCLSLGELPAVVEPGAHATFTATFLSPRPGPVDAQIALTTSDPAQPYRFFHVTGEVLPAGPTTPPAGNSAPTASAATGPTPPAAPTWPDDVWIDGPALASHLATTASASPGSASWTFADLRPREARRATIPGALVLTPSALRTLPAAVRARLVLVGGAADDDRLAAEAMRLRDLGAAPGRPAPAEPTPVRVLRGGFRTWVRAGGPLTGADALGGGGLAPADASRVLSRPGWRTLWIGDARGLPEAFVAGPVVPPPAHPDLLADALRQATADWPAGTPVLVASLHGAHYGEIEARRAALPHLALHYLEGGGAAWSDFLARQDLARQRQLVTSTPSAPAPHRPGALPSAPSGRSCGTCPQ